MKGSLSRFIACAVLALICLCPFPAYAEGAQVAMPAHITIPARAVTGFLPLFPKDPSISVTGKSCIIIGDSITARGALTKYIKEFALADSVKVRLTGTLGNGSNRHEGRSGWRMVDYVSRQYSGSAKNAFYNPSGKKFDFAYYMKSNGFLTPGYVFLEMGINDTFNYFTDSALNTEISNILARYEAVAASIHAYNKSIKIGILVTIPPTSIASTFVADYGTRQTLNRYLRNNTLWVAALKSRFKDREGSNIYLVPTDTGIDRAHIVGVHPDDTGYQQMAAVVWAWMKTH